MRLDGWKAIASHFGRERSTVIRWANDRGMPVHRIPGAKRGSVYALSEELDAWLDANREAPASEEAAPDVLPEPADAPPAIASPEIDPVHEATPETPRWWRRLNRSHPFVLTGGATAAVAAIILTANALNMDPPRAEAQVLPADAELADIFLEARSDWAERSPQSIAMAIDKLKQVVAGDPGFAPGYVALADSYLLAREFGSLSDIDAFARAQAAADAALRIDPDNADALRSLAFIQYWWRGDGPAAVRSFRSAIDGNPQSAQSHFWFGNVLVDNGDFDAGMAELERARLLEPASQPLQADIAWARWSRGDTERGRRELEALRERNPRLATVRDYLAVVYLGDGDIAGFVEETAALSRLRDLPDHIAFADRMEQALADDPASVVPLVVAQLDADIASGERTSLTWPLFVASAGGDRRMVLQLLQTGYSRGEKWGSAGLLNHVAMRWEGDRTVSDALAAMRPASLTSN